MTRDIQIILELEKLPCLNLKETSQVLGIALNTLRVEVQSGRLPVIRTGTARRRILVSRVDRERWLSNSSSWSSADAV
jgi:hypothetical protein